MNRISDFIMEFMIMLPLDWKKPWLITGNWGIRAKFHVYIYIYIYIICWATKMVHPQITESRAYESLADIIFCKAINR